MSLILNPLRCPWCGQAISKAQLRERGLLKACLARQPFDCPHCQRAVTLPERAEKLISSGLFVAVILAPLFYYYQWLSLDPRLLFGLGLALVITGLLTQRLHQADANDGQEQTDD